ncbi:MAG: hypothetical protein ACRDBG_09820 [Waterburya sp.]
MTRKQLIESALELGFDASFHASTRVYNKSLGYSENISQFYYFEKSGDVRIFDTIAESRKFLGV